MRWFSSTLSLAARRAHGLPRYGSRMGLQGLFLSRGEVRSSPPPPKPPSLPFLAPYNIGLTNITQQQCCFISTNSSGQLSETPESKAQTIEVEIISKESIKPASPTPHHLRTYKVSILDQIASPVHIPFVFFYPNNQSSNPIDVIPHRSQRLKQSLSETLTRFYPFAGKVKNEFCIDCNDEGVYYVEARVNCHLSDIISQPDGRQLIHQLLPNDPNCMESWAGIYPDSMESSAGIYVVMIQVNFFDCGGIAISLCTSHKIIDGHTYGTFFKAWAASSLGSLEAVDPSFIAPSLFPQNPTLPKDSTLIMWPSVFKQGNHITRRFVFDTSALIALKAKAASSSFVQEPTRVEAVSSLIWKCRMAASEARYGFRRPSVLSLPVNLRRKLLPPLPESSVGNLLWVAAVRCMPDTKIEFHGLVGHLRKAISKINGDFVEEMKGDEGFLKVRECLKELGEVYSNRETDYLMCTSICNTNVYEADFGWGKPVWVSVGVASAETPVSMDVIFLMDRRLGDGIEAWVQLSEQEMAVFERDPEILAFASLDPSPLYAQ